MYRKMKLISVMNTETQKIISCLEDGVFRSYRAGDGLDLTALSGHKENEILLDVERGTVQGFSPYDPVAAAQEAVEGTEEKNIPKEAPEPDIENKGDPFSVEREAGMILHAADRFRPETGFEESLRLIHLAAAGLFERAAKHKCGTQSIRDACRAVMTASAVSDPVSGTDAFLVIASIDAWFAGTLIKGSTRTDTELGAKEKWMLTAHRAAGFLLTLDDRPGLSQTVSEIIKILFSAGTVEIPTKEAALFRSVMDKEVKGWKG